MAKNNDVVPVESGGSDSIVGTLKGIFTICTIAGIGIYMSYNAGSKVSDKVLKQVNKERRKNEREKRREQRARKKEEKRKHKLEMVRALYGRN